MNRFKSEKLNNVMKVYVILYTDCEGETTLECVMDSKEKAEQYVKESQEAYINNDYFTIIDSLVNVTGDDCELYD